MLSFATKLLKYKINEQNYFLLLQYLFGSGISPISVFSKLDQPNLFSAISNQSDRKGIKREIKLELEKFHKNRTQLLKNDGNKINNNDKSVSR